MYSGNMCLEIFKKTEEKKMKEKTGLKRLIACFMAIILFLTSAPLASLAGIDNFKLKLQVNAIDQVDYSDKNVFFFVQTSPK